MAWSDAARAAALEARRRAGQSKHGGSMVKFNGGYHWLKGGSPSGPDVKRVHAFQDALARRRSTKAPSMSSILAPRNRAQSRQLSLLIAASRRGKGEST